MALKANNVLIKSIDIGAKEWQAKTWSGLTNFRGVWIWTDGANIYCSNGANQYQLDKATSTWQTKTWSGLTNFSSTDIWTDGANIYYSNGDSHYQLDKATSTWQTKTWSGLTNFYGHWIWTDGVNIYYSSGTGGSYQYQLDKATSTWQTKTWSGLTNFSGDNIWTDGANIYYSNGTWIQYQLDKATSTWLSKDWQGIVDLAHFYGNEIWQDNGGTIYFSNEEAQYELTPSIHYCYKGDTCQWVKPYTITVKVTGAPNANIKVIIYRSSNAKGQEPSAVYDSSGGESSYVLNVASTSADGQQIVGYYGDTLYVKAQSYSSGSYRYNISGQSYTVTGDGQITVNVSHSATCSSCNTSALKNICNTRCNTNLKHIGVCGDTSKTSGMCMV